MIHVVGPHEGGAGERAMGGYSVAKWFGRLLGGGRSGDKKRLGSKHTWEGSSRVRDKISRVEASLAQLDSFREDRSVLVFDWDNCESVEHESLRNSFRNMLVDDIFDHRSTVDSLSWQGVRARVRRSLRRNDTEKRRRVRNWLDDVPAPPQLRGSVACTYSSSERSGHSTEDMAESVAQRPGRGARRVGLLIWPPEIITRDVPSCYEDGMQHRTLADSSAHGRHATHHLARQLQADTSCADCLTPGAPFLERGSSADLDDLGVSAAEIILESRKADAASRTQSGYRTSIVGPDIHRGGPSWSALPTLRGILHHPNKLPRVSGNENAPRARRASTEEAG